MSTRKTGRKPRTLPAKALSDRKARAVKGGGSDIFVNFGDIKGEPDDPRKSWIEMMMPKR